MFDSLAMENQRNNARKWTTMLSFSLQIAFVSALITLPLVRPEVLSSLRIGDAMVAPVYTAPGPEVAKLVSQPSTSSNRSEMTNDGALIAPSTIPDKIATLVENEPAVPAGDGLSVVGSIPGSVLNPQMRAILKSIQPTSIIQPPPPSRERLRVSSLDPAMLIHRVQPLYPKIASAARIEGTVQLAAVIDTQGRITQLRAVSGHPFLVPAAIDAVRQWRYKPYILNGSPVEVETQVSVIFSLR